MWASEPNSSKLAHTALGIWFGVGIAVVMLLLLFKSAPNLEGSVDRLIARLAYKPSERLEDVSSVSGADSSVLPPSSDEVEVSVAASNTRQ